MKYLILVIILVSFVGNSSQTSTSKDNEMLNRARRDLLLAEETHQRVTTEYQKLIENEETPVDILADYKIYISRIRKMEDLYRQRVLRLESGIPKETPNQIEKFKPIIEEQPTTIDNLQEEFADSLGAFDEFILQELSTLNPQSSESVEDQELSGLAGEAAKAVQRLKSRGIELYTNNDTAKTDESLPENQSMKKPISSSTGMGDGGKKNRIITTPSISNQPVADDDIVARQLRELADKETDPVLREKLWGEYKAYKHSIRRKNKSEPNDEF